MNKQSFALGVVHGYNGVIGGNPYVTEYDCTDYEEGYIIGYGYLEESQRRNQMMYEIRTRWSNMVVYRTTERGNALYWLEENNQEGVFKLVRVK